MEQSGSFGDEIDPTWDEFSLRDHIIESFLKGRVNIDYLTKYYTTNPSRTIRLALCMALPELIDIETTRTDDGELLDPYIDLSDLVCGDDAVAAAVIRNGSENTIAQVLELLFERIYSRMDDSVNNVQFILMPFFEEALKYDDEVRLNILVAEARSMARSYGDHSEEILSDYLLFVGKDVDWRIVKALLKVSDLDEVYMRMLELRFETSDEKYEEALAMLEYLRHQDV